MKPSTVRILRMLLLLIVICSVMFGMTSEGFATVRRNLAPPPPKAPKGPVVVIAGDATRPTLGQNTIKQQAMIQKPVTRNG